MKALNIIVAQMNSLVGDIETNSRRIIDISNSAYQRHEADLIIFPELAITGYPPEDLLFRPELYQRVEQALTNIAEAVKETTVIVGYPKKENNHYYNQAAFIQRGKMIATYAKQSLPNYTVFDEKRYFSPGKLPCVIKIKGVSIGVIICEDLWKKFPIKKTIQSGAELIICINASPFTHDKTYVRRELLAKRSKAIKCPIIYVNLIGGQDELVFDGGSMVINQSGTITQRAKYFSEDLMLIQLDIENQLKNLTQQPLFLEPSNEEKIYHALVLGVKDYIQKNNFSGAIVGLSGGVDSALTLAIAVDAIGKENVHAVMMPSRYTSNTSIVDAKIEADRLNVGYSIIDIEPIFQAFLKQLADEFENLRLDVTEENLQSRCRGVLLMAISNKKGGIVLTTGNKSEMAVGYATLYGDMAGGFCVLKDVYKTLVYRLCKYRNTISQIIPESVLKKEPSAELSKNQKDHHTLPPYPILDSILERYITKDESAEKIIQAGFNRQIVTRVIQMIHYNEYKRRQSPIGIRITQRAFGKARRYPITSGFNNNKN